MSVRPDGVFCCENKWEGPLPSKVHNQTHYTVHVVGVWRNSTIPSYQKKRPNKITCFLNCFKVKLLVVSDNISLCVLQLAWKRCALRHKVSDPRRLQRKQRSQWHLHLWYRWEALSLSLVRSGVELTWKHKPSFSHTCSQMSVSVTIWYWRDDFLCLSLLIQTPTAGQRCRYLSSLSQGRGTPSSPWIQPVASLSARRMKTWAWTRAEPCWCSGAETTRAISTLTWWLSPWRSSSLVFEGGESEVTAHSLTVHEAILTPPTLPLLIYIPIVCPLVDQSPPSVSSGLLNVFFQFYFWKICV